MTAGLQTLVAEARSALGGPGERIGAGPFGARLELFHGANSICSQKVRAVLAHHGFGYTSYTMDMFAGQTYLPAYVRLRMAGCARLDVPLMTTHGGSTSVSAGGCDAAVVPTLVDWDAGEVVVDSKRICHHLDSLGAPAAALRPGHLAARIDAELGVVDNLPNYQMLNGMPPGPDRRPPGRRGVGGAEVGMSKVARCDRYLAEHGDDPVLVEGYSAKRAKELAGAQRLFSPEAMRDAYARAQAACTTLEHTLAGRSTRWLLDDALTMADLYWCVELLRMKNLGADFLWADGAAPAVAAYVGMAEQLPAMRSAVLDWAGATY